MIKIKEEIVNETYKKVSSQEQLQKFKKLEAEVLSNGTTSNIEFLIKEAIKIKAFDYVIEIIKQLRYGKQNMLIQVKDKFLKATKEENDNQNALEFLKIYFENKNNLFYSKYELTYAIDAAFIEKQLDDAKEFIKLLEKASPRKSSLLKYYLFQYNKATKKYELAVKNLEDALKLDTDYLVRENAIEILSNLYLKGCFDDVPASEFSIKPNASKAIKCYKYDKVNYKQKVGNIYYYGLGNQKIDYKKAMKYYFASSTIIEKGLCYYYGRGVEKNEIMAFRELSFAMVFQKEINEEVEKIFLELYEKYRHGKDKSYAPFYDKAYYHIRRLKGDKTALYYLAKDYEKSSMASIVEMAQKYYQAFINHIEENQEFLLKKFENEYKYSYEYVYKNEDERTSLIYQKLKADEGDINYCLKLAEYYQKNDIEKTKYYYHRALPSLSNNFNQLDNTYLKWFIKAYEALNINEREITIKYKAAKCLLGDNTYKKEVGFAYLNADGLIKDVNKAKLYLKDYYKQLEESIDINNIKNIDEYIKLTDVLYKQITFKYKLSKALKGDEKYAYEIGLMYANGNGVIKDINKARYFLEKVVKELEKYIDDINPNHKKIEEYMNLFNLLYKGESQYRNFKFYLAYAIKGVEEAMFIVAMYYYEGIEVPHDMEKCLMYLKKSAEKGYIPAQDKYQEFTSKSEEKPQQEQKSFDVYKAIRYIQLLELNDDEDITIEDVNNAYRQLSKIYHPDIANSRYGDGKKFVELQEAKDYLLQNIEEVKHLVCKYFK